MRHFSLSFLLALSTCLPATAQNDSQKSDSFSELTSSFQGLDLKQRLIQKEYLCQKYQVASLSSLFFEKDDCSDINALIRCEEMAALGKTNPSDCSLDLTNVLHTAGYTHLEGFLKHSGTESFLSKKSVAYQDAFQLEYRTLYDVSHILNADDWRSFTFRVEREFQKCPFRSLDKNSFYSDIRKQAHQRLIAERMQTTQYRQ